MASENRPTNAERLAARRAKAQQLREEQERREKRAKVTRRALLGVGVVAVAGVGAGVALTKHKESASATPAGQVATAKAARKGVPAPVLADGSWTYGKDLTPGSVNADAKVLDVYFDYSCHFCAAFEVLHSPEITTLLKDGKITLALHPCKILGMDWTDLVMNAQGLILDKAPEKALDFHNQVFARFAKIFQAQDASQMTAENVIATATEAGVPQDVVDQIQEAISANTYGAWTELGTSTFTGHKPAFEGTPTVVLDGEVLDLGKINKADGLTAVVGA